MHLCQKKTVEPPARRGYNFVAVREQLESLMIVLALGSSVAIAAKRAG